MMKTVLFFAPDGQDAAVKRRIRGLGSIGFKVSAFAYERGLQVEGVKSLGSISDGQGFLRIWRLACSFFYLRKEIARLRPDIILARNIDLLFLAHFLALFTDQKPKIFYEMLDVHETLCGPGWKARVLRTAERMMLSNISGIITSSPAFKIKYFQEIQNIKTPIFLLENKLEPPVPVLKTHNSLGPSLTICFNGKIRCRQSLELLHRIALRFPNQVALRISGAPNSDLKVAFDKIFQLPNVSGLGRYTYPDDLAKIYAGAHLNWAIDLQTDFNSKNLLPNRIYEGTAFGVPPLVRAGTATAEFVAAWGCAIVLAGDLEDALVQLILHGRPQIARALQAVGTLPRDRLVGANTYRDLLQFMQNAR